MKTASFWRLAPLSVAAACTFAPLRPITAPTTAARVNQGDNNNANSPSASTPHTASPLSSSGSEMPSRTAAQPPAPRRTTVTAPIASSPLTAGTRDEVVEAATAVFGDSTGVADLAGIAKPVWDLDVRSYETHDRVAHYVNLFTGTARARFSERLTRGTRYEPMIRAKLRASGMPEDLTYLALIESGYDPDAYSRAAAVGMWQFMSSTARDLGMRVDWWMDERRDPARATDGAIRFLGFLNRQFGSMYLAAAAYNGGPGRVARGLTRFADELEGVAGEDRFFALAEQDYLRAETRNYVPQLIAAALVAKTPSRYGLPIDSLPGYGYDSVLVDAATRLAVVASAGAIDRTLLRELNPALLRGMTPPDAAVWVRVPAGRGDSVRMALDTIEKSERAAYREVAVSGATTTPTEFASKHGVSVKHLRWYNPAMKVSKKGRLTTGQRLRVPHADAIAMARELPDPGIERYGSAATGSRSSAAGVHVVRRGETLGAIAKRYGLSETQLRSMNGMRGTRILAGQALAVRRSSTVSTRTSSTSTKASATSTSSKTKATKAKSSASKSAKAKSAKAKSSKAKSSKAKSSKTTVAKASKSKATKPTGTKKPTSK